MADHRHKRDTEARRKPKAQAIIGPLAVLATASVVTIGVLGADPAASDLAPLSISSAVDRAVGRAQRGAGHPLRRTASRPPRHADLPPPAFMSKAAITAAIKAAKKQQWTTDDLNIWNQPGDKAKLLGEIEAGKKVVVTGREMWGRTEIVLKGESRWVTDGYLSDEKPLGVGAGLSMAPAPTAASRAASPTTPVFVYRSVCNAFPEITSYGGWSSHGEHSSGRAVDIMTSDVEAGHAIAEFLRANASELDLSDVI